MGKINYSILILFFFFSIFTISAQESDDLWSKKINQQKIKSENIVQIDSLLIPKICLADSKNDITNNPIWKKENLKKEKFIKDYISNINLKKLGKKSVEENGFVIPIVFHIYANSWFTGNVVDDEIVKLAIKETNEDFQGLAIDWNTIDAPFETVKETLNITFKLAQIDPEGNPTTGIVYHGFENGFGEWSNNSKVQQYAWDNSKYMNVYIQNDLYGDNVTNNSGVAWHPWDYMTQNNWARVVYNGNYLSSANTSENFRSVLTHEFGHFLDLYHTFEGSSCAPGEDANGDLVIDTPQQAAHSSGTNCNIIYNCLSQEINNENFMDYTDCYKMFTSGQVQRMTAALNYEPLSSLWQESNLIATGLLEGPSISELTLSNTTIDENSIVGTKVGELSVIDIFNRAPYTYSLILGEGDLDNNSFVISENKLVSNEVLDYESKSSYSVRIQVEDNYGEKFSKSFIILINDLDEREFSSIQDNFISGIDTLKVANSPYISTNDIVIYQDATLVIEDGVEWFFDLGVGLRVLGTLETIGETLRTTRFSSSSPTEGNWSGIFLDESTNSIINNSIIEYADIGIKVVDDRDPAEPLIKNNEIRFCGNGIFVEGNRDSRFYIDSNIIHENNYGIYTYMAEPIIINNVIYKNKFDGLYFNANTCGGGNLCNNSSPFVVSNLIYKNKGRAININNSSPFISDNSLVLNEGDAIYISNFSPIINKNNFVGKNSNTLNLVGGVSNIDAKNNWWSTKDKQEISNLIFDTYDNADLGIVDFEPFFLSINNSINNIYYNGITFNERPPRFPVENLELNSSGSDYVEIQWDESIFPNTTGYRIYYSKDKNSFPYDSFIDVGNISSAQINNLEGSSQYYFSVTNYDSEGNESWYSNEIEAIINESPTDIVLTNTSIDENTELGSEIGSISSIDADNEDIHTYSLVEGEGDIDNSRFYISGIRLLTKEMFDYETKNSYTVRIQTNDGNGGIFSKAFTILVNDLIEDDDNDGIMNNVDNCPEIPNSDQADLDGDGIGDVCDDDIDGDGILNADDFCPEFSSDNQADLDEDGIGDVCDDDMDGDGILNADDLCPEFSSDNQADIDEDGIGDVCDDDMDGDGILNADDLCPEFSSDNQADIDGDGIGDVCDDDIDGDGILKADDNCPDTQTGTIVDANGCTLLSSDNFSIEVTSETCPNKNNGQLKISANESRDYKLTINGDEHNFTTEKILSDLTPGTYDICIEVPDITSPYCYVVKVEEGVKISGKSSINNKQLQVELSEGTLPYQVFVNGNLRFETYQNDFNLDVDHGDIVEVKTSVECEGLYSKKIELFDNLTIYPNPSEGLFTIALPTNDKQVDVSVFNDISQLVVSNTYEAINSRVQIDLTDKPEGVYIVKVYLDKEYVFKVVKK